MNAEQKFWLLFYLITVLGLATCSVGANLTDHDTVHVTEGCDEAKGPPP